WRMWLSFNERRSAALQLDALDSTHPVLAKVRNADEAHFDAITYGKGASVLRMIESYVGERDFRRGVRRFVKAHEFGNATASELWDAIAAASNKPVRELAERWINQSGFPLVELSERGDNRIQLTQSRFSATGGENKRGRWPVPILLRYEDPSGIHEQRI